MRTPQTEEFWKAELTYIRGVTPETDPAFNRDVTCFAGYVRMQARCARADGFAEIADAMLERIEVQS